MFKNPRVILFSVLVVAALIVAYLLADRQGWFASRVLIRTPCRPLNNWTPEIASLSEQIRNAPSNAGLFYSRGNAYYDFGNLRMPRQIMPGLSNLIPIMLPTCWDGQTVCSI